VYGSIQGRGCAVRSRRLERGAEMVHGGVGCEEEEEGGDAAGQRWGSASRVRADCTTECGRTEGVPAVRCVGAQWGMTQRQVGWGAGGSGVTVPCPSATPVHARQWCHALRSAAMASGVGTRYASEERECMCVGEKGGGVERARGALRVHISAALAAARSVRRSRTCHTATGSGCSGGESVDGCALQASHTSG
jgi:hypothetical protein